MSENKALLDAIMRAIELEKETFDFYTKAEQKTFNSEGKKVFKWLARNEESHYMRLNDLYKSLHESGRWVFYGGATIDLEPADESGKVTFDTDDRKALEIALDIEKKSRDYYKKLLVETTDSEGRLMLEALMAEEEEHISVINARLSI